MQKGYASNRKTGSRPPTAKKTKASNKGGEEKKVRRNNSPKKSNDRGGLKRLTEAQMKRLKEHSKMHKGGMGSKHMRKMMMVMTKEGKSFSEAHRIAVKHDKKK